MTFLYRMMGVDLLPLVIQLGGFHDEKTIIQILVISIPRHCNEDFLVSYIQFHNGRILFRFFAHYYNNPIIDNNGMIMG